MEGDLGGPNTEAERARSSVLLSYYLGDYRTSQSRTGVTLGQQEYGAGSWDGGSKKIRISSKITLRISKW